jgi:hypothetical protein
MNFEMYDATFPIHLVIIKVAFSIFKKTKVGAFVQLLLDSQLLDKQSFFFPIDYASQCRINNG